MMTRTPAIVLFFWGFCLTGPAVARQPGEVVAGSKVFTESVILAELATQTARHAGYPALHRDQLGGTRILWNALRSGDIDLYPEYTGTLLQEILTAHAPADPAHLADTLATYGLLMTAPLGFNNTYALGMKEERARALGIRTISDLRGHPELVLGFSNEFMDRGDGWPALQTAYRLPQHDVRGMDHDLGYRALSSGAIDVIDLYSTDAEIDEYHLRTLEDDLGYFPDYQAVYLYRSDLIDRAPAFVAALHRLEGQLPEANMVHLNARVKRDRIPEQVVAADFLRDRFGWTESRAGTPETRGQRLWRRTGEHLFLVGLSLLAAILISIPLGILAARYARAGQVILGVVGVIYTIPSLALLVFMIPLLGIGGGPAIFALFLYSLLPIVRNTHTGLRTIPPALLASAEALGLTPGARLRLVELPLASPDILAGIKTAAVINIGTATLGALIGAGGYGQPILTGIRLDDVGLILEGAVPAALLALATQGLFELGERWLVPKGLRR